MEKYMKPILWKYLETVTRADMDSTLEAWRRQQSGLGVLALVSEQEQGVVALLQLAATEAGMPLAGAVVPGLIADASFWRKGVLLISFDAGFPRMIVPLTKEMHRTSDAAVSKLADFIDTHAGEDGSDTLLMFVDAMTPDVTSLLSRLYLEIGDQVKYVGTSVGSETFKSVPCVFDNENFIQDGLLAMLLPRYPSAVIAHHYCGDASLRVATATDGNRIRMIDGQPAFDIYRELMASAYAIDLTQESFYRYAVHYPFAINLAEGEPLVRLPVAVENDGSIFCSGEIPENALLSIVEAVPAGNMITARELATGVRALDPAGALAFYCAGRHLHLDDGAAKKELAALAEGLAPTVLVGALSLGEIGSGQQQGYPQFHNATIVVLPWP